MKTSFIGTVKEVSYYDREDFGNDIDLPDWMATVSLEHKTDFCIMSDSIDFPDGRDLKNYTDKS